MLRLNNLEGVLMSRNQEMLSFELKDDFVSFSEITPIEKVEVLPIEFEMDGYTSSSIYRFLNWCLPPAERASLPKSCEYAGIEMTGDAIIRYTHGHMLNEPFWIKWSNGPQTFEELIEDEKVRARELTAKEIADS